MKPGVVLSFDKIALVAGTNALDETKIQQLQEHPDYQRFSKLKAIEVVQQSETIDPMANTEIIDLGSYAIEEAATVINSTVDLMALDAWLKTEQRKSVRTSIATRINQLKQGLA
jgi:hypothetical protein